MSELKGRRKAPPSVVRAKEDAERPAFSKLRQVTSDHVDSSVLDEPDDHHPHEYEPEVRDGSSDRTLQEEPTNEVDATEGRRRIGEKSNATNNLNNAEKGQAISPQDRSWKDDIVTFDSKDDPQNPKNWSYNRKVLTTFLYGSTTMCSTFASSVFSPALPYVATQYGISSEVAVLGISLFVSQLSCLQK